MCAILDANVVSEVFGANQPPAGKGFFDWINTGGGRLVTGGRLREELQRSSDGFRNWATQAQLYGRVRVKDTGEVDARTVELQAETALRSDDPHIIALAQVAGSRLLYSQRPRPSAGLQEQGLDRQSTGSVYSTLRTKNLTSSRKRQLVSRDELCRFHT